MEGFEMREMHRQLLARSRTYLLHNLRPTETFWSTLQARDMLSEDMVEDIKSHRTRNEQIGKLLDLLPARGPTAWDQFCETLLECDHSHVAEYLKSLEATDSFRTEISRHCTISDGMVEQFVSIYKNSTPMIKRFAEQKFELMLEEQGRDLEEKEAELHDITGKLNIAELEKSQLQAFINTCHGISEDINREIQTEVISKSFLRETFKYIDTLKEQGGKDLGSYDMIQQYYSNMQALLSFLEQHSDKLRKDPVDAGNRMSKERSWRPYSALRRIGSAFDGMGNGTMKSKMHIILRNLTSVIETIGTRTYVTAALIRPDLEHVVVKFKEIIDDVFYVKDVFKTTLKQKRKLESELMSLVHNWQETRRLEREVKEKQGHISELNKESQVLRKKTRGSQHRKQLEQIQNNVEQKRSQLRELQKALERHLGSADVRIHSLLGLLPDLDDGDRLGRADTEMFSEATGSQATSRISSAQGHSQVKGAGGDRMNGELKDDKQIQEGTESKANTARDIGEKSDAESPRKDIKSQSDAVNGTSRLLERRYSQQQASNRLAHPRTRVQANKGPTPMKYNVPKQVVNVRDSNNKQAPREKLTTRIHNILNKNKDPVPASEQPPKVNVVEDPIDQWLAKQNEQTKSDELQKKVLEFKVVEGQDRSEEIKKLGRTLKATFQAPQPKALDPEGDTQQQAAEEADRSDQKDIQVKSEEPVTDSNKNSQLLNTPRPKSRSNSVAGVSPLLNGSATPTWKNPYSHANLNVPLSPQQNISVSRTQSSSRETSKDSNDSRTKSDSSPTEGADSRPGVSLSVMAGDLLSCVPHRSTPYTRQSVAIMEATLEAYRRNQGQGQRQVISTNKVNLSLMGHRRS